MSEHLVVEACKGHTGSSARMVRRTQMERSSDATLGLVEASLTVLALNGFSGFTLAKVAKEAGCSTGLAAYHFGSKGALIHAAMDYAFRYGVQVAEVSRRIDQSPLDDLLSIVDGYFLATREKQLFIRGVNVLLTEGMHSRNKSIADRVAAFSSDCRQYVMTLIERGVAARCIRNDISADNLATIFTALIMGVQHVAISMTPDLQIPGLHQSLRDAVIKTFSPSTDA